ncbi:MAG: hypothetical protein R2757_22125 [Draconibacterium sp.]
MKATISMIVFVLIFVIPTLQTSAFEKESIKTPEGNLIITFIGHGTLMMEHNGKVIRNSKSVDLAGIKIVAVQSYNIKNKHEIENPSHPKGSGNRHVLHFGDTNIYVAGDTKKIT